MSLLDNQFLSFLALRTLGFATLPVHVQPIHVALTGKHLNL
jgi:hypothetical protein